MEFPFGHHGHRPHRKVDEEEEQSYPPPGHRPPGPFYGGREELDSERHPPPPPPSHHQMPEYRRHGEPAYGEYGYSQGPQYGRVEEDLPSYQRPPPSSDVPYSAYSDPRPGYSSVQHVSHEINQDPPPFRREEGRHNPFGFFHRPDHGRSDTAGKPTVRVFCQADENYSLSIRDGKVILARADPSDEFQHWIKDEKYSVRVKDEEGFPCFSLVNKATGQALKHSIGATHPVQLWPYNPDVLDESVLWTESKDVGAGFRTIRMVNNIRLNLDAFHGDKDHGGVRDGTILVLWEWAKGGNQKWKIVPNCKFECFPLNVCTGRNLDMHEE